MRLLFVVALLGAVYGQTQEDACSALQQSTPDKLEDRIVVVVKDSADESVGEVKEGNSVYVTVTIPPIYTATSVDCLLGLGLAHKWRRMMPASCQTAPVTEGGATCVFTVTNVNASRDLAQERLDVRVGIKHATGYLRARYDGNPISFRPEQRDRPAAAPAPPASPIPVVVNEQVKLEDPHDSKMEAYLAAKWAEQRQQMADDEDKNSEGNWQKLEQDEKRQHEAEIQKELQEYEARTAEQRRRQEEMIRQEMLDKEENERLEDEFRRKSSSTAIPPPNPDRMVEEEEVDMSNTILDDSAAGHSSGLIPALVLLISAILAAILL